MTKKQFEKLKKGTPIRISVTKKGQKYILFRGRISDFDKENKLTLSTVSGNKVLNINFRKIQIEILENELFTRYENHVFGKTDDGTLLKFNTPIIVNDSLIGVYVSNVIQETDHYESILIVDTIERRRFIEFENVITLKLYDREVYENEIMIVSKYLNQSY